MVPFKATTARCPSTERAAVHTQNQKAASVQAILARLQRITHVAGAQPEVGSLEYGAAEP